MNLLGIQAALPTSATTMLSKTAAPVRLGTVAKVGAIAGGLVLAGLAAAGVWLLLDRRTSDSPLAQVPPDAAARAARDGASQLASSRAITAWNDMNRTAPGRLGLTHPSATGMYRERSESLGAAHVWPMSQVHAAAIDLSQLTGDRTSVAAIDGQLKRYLRDGAYQPGRGVQLFPQLRDRYTDDNMAIGLNYVQAFDAGGDPRDLARAEQVMPFLESMVHDNGAINWREGSTAYVADSLVGAQKLALLLATRTPDAERRTRYLEFARSLDTFVEANLRRHDGEMRDLLIDNVGSNNETAGWSNAFFSYNQGWSIGADIEWWRATGDATYLERARRTADASYEFLARDDRLWTQPPSFNANYFENLLALEAIAPRAEGDTRFRDWMGEYLDRAWTTARDPETGYFHRGGIGGYTVERDGERDQVDLLDQAGMVQMYALRAMTREQLLQVA